MQAHAYAYGGCILQDMGYYPFGSKFFSDLVHYVRTGDFVLALIRESQDLDEYAFALGALAHYAADNEGHSIAVNPSVPVAYPKLKRKYGKVVTYADDPTAHLRVEFGFDVLQVARGSYAPQAYHDFIGFQVAKPVLERAFRDTYCLGPEGCVRRSRPGAGNLPVRREPGDSGDDQGRVETQGEGPHRGESRDHPPQVRIQPVARQLSQGMGRPPSGARASARASWHSSFGSCPRSDR